MADRTKHGRRVRRLREGRGLTQVEMAKRLSISASYLNLIEHDQRPITAKLALRLGQIFDGDLGAFSDSENRRILDDLREVIVDPIFGGRIVGEDEVRDVVGASPDVGRAMLTLYRAYRSAREEADGLGEELRNRELLAGINYEFRNVVASIRSFAEILQDNPDLDVERRRQFVGVILEDSRRLVPLVGALLAIDASTDTPAADRRPPIEDVADFLQANSGYFAELEDAADEARRAYLGQGRPEISGGISAEARTLAVARRHATECCQDVIARCADTARWTSAEARNLAIEALTDYLAAAILMPYEPFRAAAREVRHDIERLQRRFGVGFEQVCRRLTTLQRAGVKGLPFHIVKVDMAGNVAWRLGSTGFRVPRHGGLCSLWNVHAAFLSPDVTRVQLSRMPDGIAYFSIARAIRGEEPEIVGSPRFSAIELGCDVSFARDIVYADGLELGGNAAVVPIGTTCRLCERLDCTARVVPPFR